MKTTVDLPDELHRRVKSKAAMEGTSITVVVVRLLEGYVGQRAMADAVRASVALTHADAAAPATVRPSGRAPDLSKAAQAKGRMGR